MKLLFDFFPIIFFFVVFHFYDVYVATAVLIPLCILQVLVFWLKYHRFDGMLLFNTSSAILLGSVTLLLHNDIFIKWKPTIIYWGCALIFLGSQFIGNKTFIERTLGGNINLPTKKWGQLNLLWVAFFALIGAVNLYVAYHYSTNAWVNFKLIGIIGSFFVFVLLQGIFLARYIQPDDPLKPETWKAKK